MPTSLIQADDLIRRVRFADQTKNGKVSPGAFKPDKDDLGSGLSVTQCNDAVKSEEDVDTYREETCHFEAGFLGLCVVPGEKIRECEQLSVTPDVVEGPYGKQHCLLSQDSSETKCPDVDRRSLLAKWATQKAIVRHMVPAEPPPGAVEAV